MPSYSDDMKTLRDNPLWKESVGIAEKMYSLADEISDSNPDEKWNTERKIRNTANDMMFYISQVVAKTTIDTAEYDWNNARKSLFGLQTMYIFATKKHFLELEPELVVRIDKLIAKIDEGIEKSHEEAEQNATKEMEPWLEKYNLWKKMQD